MGARPSKAGRVVQAARSGSPGGTHENLQGVPESLQEIRKSLQDIPGFLQEIRKSLEGISAFLEEIRESFEGFRIAFRNLTDFGSL